MVTRARGAASCTQSVHRAKQGSSNCELRHRVISYINKLSDRDTQAIAEEELEAIARTLKQDSIATFLSCLHQTDSSAKPAARRHVVILLLHLSSSHGSALGPFLPKLISILTRRLRDPDSSVRAACAAAAASLSSSNKDSFSLLFGSLVETLCTEKDVNAQLGAAMCVEAVVTGGSADALRVALPRLRRLARSEGFKPKGALLGVIGCVVGGGGATCKADVEWLVPCLVGFLSSDDWSARKAAAEALGKLAETEPDLAKDYKVECVGFLESRRFDRVKQVRECMNHSLRVWKELPDSVCSKKDRDYTPEGSDVETETKLVVKTRGRKANEAAEFDDLSAIRKQLNQIESQQYNLVELLQDFIGKSRSGMSSLETRVSGLEMALDEMSCDKSFANYYGGNRGYAGLW